MKLKTLAASLIALATFSPTSPASPSAAVAKHDDPARDEYCLADDFESYADQPAFETAWRKVGSPAYALDTTVGRDSKHAVKLNETPGGNGNSNRFYRDLPHPLTPTDDAPVIFSFDLYLDPAGAPVQWRDAWQTLDIRGYSNGGYGKGDVTGVLSMGLARASANPWSASFFQSRLYVPVLPAPAIQAQYHTLNSAPNAPQRAPGWHTLSARIGATSISYSVDGVPAGVVQAGIAQPLTTVVIGSDVNSGGNILWCDNLLVRQPRPARK